MSEIPPEYSEETYRKAVGEMLFYISSWMIILILAYYIGINDPWWLLILSALWWGVVGIVFTWPRKNKKEGQNAHS